MIWPIVSLSPSQIPHFPKPAKTSDTLVFMDEGVVVEAGHPREMIKEPKHERTKAFLSRVL